MRVAILTRDYPPVVGGASTYAGALVTHLRSLGVVVDVFVGTSDSKTILLSLNRDFKEYDLVHVHSGPYAALVRKKPLVVTVFAPVLIERKRYTLGSKIKSVFAIECEKLAFRKAAIIAISEQTRLDLVQAYGVRENRIEVIPCGVEYERFATPRSYAAKLPIRILLLSRLEPRKNIGEALRALNALPSGSYEAKVVGEGSQMQTLKRMAVELRLNAEITGKVSDENLARIYNEADIFITASHSEGFGLTLLEAMASGCAVIASNIPTHGDLVNNGINGFIYNDLTDLITTLRRLVNQPRLIETLGSAARKRAKSFSWHEVGRKTLELYSRCLSS